MISLNTCGLFLSTLSLRRATHYGWSWYDDFTISIHALLAESDLRVAVPEHVIVISIHALLAESDLADCTKIYAVGDFYPRSPCGERRVLECTYNAHVDFYPRSPCGERLGLSYFYIIKITISIHALLAESDPKIR